MNHTHIITPELISLEKLEQIISRKVKLELSQVSKKLIQKCRNYLNEKVKQVDTPIYGVTTGFGALYNKTISEDQLSQLQENLVKSHACGTGNEVSEKIVKLMLFLKIHALSMGHSGVQIATVERIIDFYNHHIFPIVYEQGSLGASGDLSPLAHLFMPVLGLGEVRYKGKRMHTSEILKQFGWKPIVLQSKEGLAMLNGTQFMSSHGVVAILRAMKLIKLSNTIAALSLEAYDGRIEPFYDNIHQIRPHNGQIKTAQYLRKVLEGSKLINRKKQHIQDPYSFRCIPQVHGATNDAADYVSKVVETEINSVTDNPTIFPDEDLVISGGNFHGQPLAISFDFLGIALAELGSISERRVYRLISGGRELPEFLVANSGLNSGFMIPQYTAASIVSQNKQLCTPSSIDSIPSSNEQEDHVSMGANGATKLIRIIDNIERILAIELFNAAQALNFRGLEKTSPYLNKFVSDFRKEVPFVDQDIEMYKMMHKSIDFVHKYELDSI